MQIIRFNEAPPRTYLLPLSRHCFASASPGEKRAVPHFQRFKDALLHEGFIGLAGQDLDDASKDREARTAVGPPAAGREIQGLPGYQGYVFGQRVVECAGNVLELREAFPAKCTSPHSERAGE